MRGYKEEGTTTTPFDMTVLNDLDRFHLVIDVIDRVPRSAPMPRPSSKPCATSSPSTRAYIAKHGDDMPEIRDWKWNAAAAVTSGDRR